jgi:hypothetical protein
MITGRKDATIANRRLYAKNDDGIHQRELRGSYLPPPILSVEVEGSTGQS